MKINANMSAVLTNKQLLRTENKLRLSMERLSSGYKINSAGDNPTGMAISNKMRAQLDALDQATDNSSNAVSTLQIADGALNEVSSILQRMRELSVQAANGTNSYEDKMAIQQEIEQLTKEVDRISKDTEYNTKTLLDGSSDVRVYTQPKAAQRIQISSTVSTGVYGVHVDEPGEQAEASFSNFDTIASDGQLTINDKTICVTAGETKEQFYQDLHDVIEQAGCVLDEEAFEQGEITLKSAYYGSSSEISISCTQNLADLLGVSGYENAQTTDDGRVKATVAGKDAKVSFPDDDPKAAGYTSTATISSDGNRITVNDKDGFSIDFLLEDGFANDNLMFEVTDIGSMTIQIGGNQYQTMNVRISEVSSKSLYLDTINVAIYDGADRAISTLDDAIYQLNATRSRIGAYQNRLEYTTSSLSETNEDMTAAYSTILDTDMAKEMTEYTKLNVLQQAATSVLAQANDLPQQVLSLLQ